MKMKLHKVHHMRGRKSKTKSLTLIIEAPCSCWHNIGHARWPLLQLGGRCRCAWSSVCWHCRCSRSLGRRAPPDERAVLPQICGQAIEDPTVWPLQRLWHCWSSCVGGLHLPSVGFLNLLSPLVIQANIRLLCGRPKGCHRRLPLHL